LNAHIIERLNGLADAIELGSISVIEIRDTLIGHTESVEGAPYAMIKEAQNVWAQLSQAIEANKEKNVDVYVLGNWLRAWAARVPTGSD
jgi:hypothetical protein